MTAANAGATAPTTSARYQWNGLTVSHSTTRTGVDLSPEWALVRVRNWLSKNRGAVTGLPSSGELDFDERSVGRFYVGGGYIPDHVAGEVTAKSIPNGIVVTARASVAPAINAFVVSAVGIPIFLALNKALTPRLYAEMVGAVAVALGFYVRGAARTLRDITTAGTTL